MSNAIEQLKQLAQSSRIEELREIANEDIRYVWDVFKVLGFHDEDICFVIRDAAHEEYHRRQAERDLVIFGDDR